MAMPSAWIDRIFEKLQLVYGSHFTGRWSGGSIEAVKADWAHELDGMESHPESIKHALQHLPVDQPPTVLQFRQLCRNAPTPPSKALPAPEVDKAKAAQVLAQCRDVFARKGDHLDTLRELAESDARDGTFRGRKVTLAQRQTYRQALGMDRKESTHG